MKPPVAFLKTIGRVTRTAVPDASGGAAGPIAIPFTMQMQTESNWCWAAVSTSVSLYFDVSSKWSQCTVANSAWNRRDCCGSGSSGPCNQPWYLDRALTIVDCLSRMNSSLESFPIVQREIAATRPLCARIGWSSGGGHFVAIAGWQVTADGVDYYHVHDPIWGVQILPRHVFETAYRSNGSWTHSYFVRKPGSAAGAGVASAALPLYPDAIGA
ncbi:MAG: papain-like cysteine protease family protein [Mesorhizobium sp.]|nr:papain-like cysteine protease family protein [Mesorhizobium sp.]